MRRRRQPTLLHLPKPCRRTIPSRPLLYPTILTKEVFLQNHHAAVLILYHAAPLGRCEQLVIQKIQKSTKPFQNRGATMLEQPHIALFGRCE